MPLAGQPQKHGNYYLRPFGSEVILVLIIAIVFRKQQTEVSGQQISDERGSVTENRKEFILGSAWYVFYLILSYISCALQIDMINELSNWLFLVLFPC